LEVLLTENEIDIDLDEAVDSTHDLRRLDGEPEYDSIAVELGIWLSGIESFLVAGHHSFADVVQPKIVPDAGKEFRIVNSVLQRCSLLNVRLLDSRWHDTANQTLPKGIETGGLRELAGVLREAMLLSEGITYSTQLSSGEWKAWSNLLSSRFHGLAAFRALIRHAESAGERYLPARLVELVDSGAKANPEISELKMILPQFGKILKWLCVVGKMLDADEPLKPALLIFSRVNEQIFELTSYINSRLEKFPNDEAEIFASLDAASYTSSIELKKVYSQELAGLARMRPTPSIFARMETAHSLLNDGFQQILAGFAKQIDPNIDIFELFPEFKKKFEESIALRKELRVLSDIVQSTEKEPEQAAIDKMHNALHQFTKQTVHFLFYKDTETVERFIEEILVTRQNKDLVPTLHRFGAYLETLFGQVNLRAVLENHPFESGEA